MSRDVIAETVKLEKSYYIRQREIKVLRGIDLRIFRGEFLCIAGRSGSGKTTLLNMLGLLDRPTRGEIIIDGIRTGDIKEKNLFRLRRRKCGFVFQQFYLLPYMTALENVALPLKYSGIGKKEREKRAKMVLEMMGLGDRLNHNYFQLSGGEAQRVAIARAIINRPKLLLADEPTGELDTQTAKEIIELIQKINQQEGQTVVMVTHDPVAIALASRKLQLEDGKLIKNLFP